MIIKRDPEARILNKLNILKMAHFIYLKEKIFLNLRTGFMAE